jgi:hypothetical protein
VQAQKSLGYLSAFIVDEVALRRLDGIVREHSEGLTYQVVLSDGTVLLPPQFEDVLGLTNSASHKIRKISAETSYSAALRIDLSIDADGGWDKTLKFTVRGEEKNVVFVSGKLDEWASTVSQWYGLISFPRFWTAILQSYAVCGGILLIWVGNSSQWSLARRTVASVFGLVLITSAFALSLLRRWVFPPGIFAIGDGQRRLATFQTRQKVFKLGTILAPIGTVLLGMLANKLSH